MTTPACPSCGYEPFGPYCRACGERQQAPTDYSLRHFAAEAAEAVASPDSRTLRTLRLLLFKPGFLTTEYFGGRRTLYLRPLQLFLVCNLAFFLLQPQLRGLNIFTTTFHDQLQSMPYSAMARSIVYSRVEPNTQEFRVFERRFNEVTHDHARTLVIAMTPIFALVLAALYRRSRRYFVEHLVFSTHFYSFFILLVMTVWVVVVSVLSLGRKAGVPYEQMAWLATDAAYSLLVLAVVAVYLTLAMRRVYSVSPAGTLVRSIVATIALFWVLSAYRLILLFTVLTFM